MLTSSRVGVLAIVGALAIGTFLGGALVDDAHALAPVGKPSKQPAAKKQKDTFPQEMLCRGPWEVSGGASANIRGRERAAAAGGFGMDLAPGECAFWDRGLIGDERAEISFDYTGNTNGANIGLGVAAGLSVCGLDENCIMAASVEPAGNGYFKTVINMAPRRWKRGEHPAQP